KRTSTARTKIWNSASSTKATAVVTTSGVLSECFAHLDRAVAGGLHGIDEVLLHLAAFEHPNGRLGRAALGCHLRAQGGRFFPPLDSKLGRAHEGPERERSRGALGEPQLARGLLERLDGVE